MSINILVPMTGPNKFEGDEYGYPKPLIDIGGKTIIQRSFETYAGFGRSRKMIPIISLEDVRQFNLDFVIRQIVPAEELKIIELKNRTGGALCTALLAIDEINNDTPLIITSSDHIIDHTIVDMVEHFQSQDVDFGVPTFKAVHPKWSFVRLSPTGDIEEAAEKRPISNNAIAGLYYFKKGSDFVESAKNALFKRSTHSGIYYVSSSLNEMVLLGKRGCVYEIPYESYTNFYDISAVKNYSDKLKQSSLQGENEIRRLSRRYVANFNARRLEDVTSVMHEEFVLEDPVIKRIEGRSHVKQFLKKLFESVNELSFTAVDIAVFHNKSFIQFELNIDAKHIRGVDIITWSQGKMESLTAYMEEVQYAKITT